MTFQAAKKTKQNDAMHFTAGAVPVPVALESEYSGELPPEVFSKVNHQKVQSDILTAHRLELLPTKIFMIYKKQFLVVTIRTDFNLVDLIILDTFIDHFPLCKWNLISV